MCISRRLFTTHDYHGYYELIRKSMKSGAARYASVATVAEKKNKLKRETVDTQSQCIKLNAYKSLTHTACLAKECGFSLHVYNVVLHRLERYAVVQFCDRK